MTLVEVMIALGITGLVVGGIVGGYIFSTTSAEKAALTLAANTRALERIEETRSAQWVTSISPGVDQLVPTNFPPKVVILDLSGSGVGVTSATLLTEITSIPGSSPLRRIHVDCVWSFKGVQFTNTIEICRAPD